MDTNALRTKLFRHLWRGGQYAFFWTTHYNRSFWFKISEMPKSVRADYPHCLFFGVHPVTEIPTTNAQGKPKPPERVRSQIKSIAVVNCLFAEFDRKCDETKHDLLNRVRLVTPTPSVIIDSGGGYHLYWLLDQPMILSDEFSAMLKLLLPSIKTVDTSNPPSSKSRSPSNRTILVCKNTALGSLGST